MPERGGHPDRQRAAIGAPGTSMDTVLQLLAFQAQTRGAAPAILAPHIVERAPIDARRNPRGGAQ
ncbi:MAG TPA: hypothetical protein VIH15_07055, partial [Casimicrobiaceae bacterium]